MNNFSRIDDILTFSDNFYVISIMSGDTLETVYYPTNYIDLHRYIPEIKDICKSGNCTAYICVNPTRFDKARKSLLKKKTLCGYDNLRNVYLAAQDDSALVIHISDKTDNSYTAIKNVVSKYTDKVYRFDDIKGQCIVVTNVIEMKKLKDELATLPDVVISSDLALFTVSK